MTFNINDIPSQKGRIAVVTGSNTGLGYETALALAQKEAKVVLACRNTAVSHLNVFDDLLLVLPTTVQED